MFQNILLYQQWSTVYGHQDAVTCSRDSSPLLSAGSWAPWLCLYPIGPGELGVFHWLSSAHLRASSLDPMASPVAWT